MAAGHTWHAHIFFLTRGTLDDMSGCVVVSLHMDWMKQSRRSLEAARLLLTFLCQLPIHDPFFFGILGVQRQMICLIVIKLLAVT